MTAPIKTCDYCGATGEMPTFMNGETICYTCLHVLPKTLPEARQELMRLRAELATAQPTANFADAYQGAMEEVAIWKKRALEAEDLNRKFVAEINGPTYMGEPAHPKPDCGEAGHDEGRCGNRRCLPGAQPAPSVPTALLVAVADLCAQMEIVSRVGFVDTPNDKDSCAAFCVAEGTWLELMSAIESLASALAAAPEAKP